MSWLAATPKPRRQQPKTRQTTVWQGVARRVTAAKCYRRRWRPSSNDREMGERESCGEGETMRGRDESTMRVEGGYCTRRLEMQVFPFSFFLFLIHLVFPIKNKAQNDFQDPTTLESTTKFSLLNSLNSRILEAKIKLGTFSYIQTNNEL